MRHAYRRLAFASVCTSDGLYRCELPRGRRVFSIAGVVGDKSPYRIYEVVGLVKCTRIHRRSRGLSRAPVGCSSRPLTALVNADHRTGERSLLRSLADGFLF